MRGYFVALGLTTLFLGLPILFAGYVGIGCSMTTSAGSTVLSNCGGAAALELAGAVLILAALVFFAASFVPVRHTG
jgi:hypothetical protein